MAIVTFEGQSHTLSIADLREVMQFAWPEPVEDVHQELYDALSQPTHPRAQATLAVLRRVFSLLTPEADSGTFRPRWADEAHSELIIDIEKRATTKGALFAALLKEEETVDLSYLMACYLTWRERQSMLSFAEILRLQPLLVRLVEQGCADLAAGQGFIERLRQDNAEAGMYLPLGY
jgi:hypothetical protein